MKPKNPDIHQDLFRSQLSQILNLSYHRNRRANQINWQRIEQEIDAGYSSGPSYSPLPTRLLVGLHYLKYTFDESNELERETKVGIVGKTPKRAKASLRCWMKRRASIEPTIGHPKSDHRMEGNFPKGNAGDEVYVILATAKHNLTRLPAWFYRVCEIWRLFRPLSEITRLNRVTTPPYAWIVQDRPGR